MDCHLDIFFLEAVLNGVLLAGLLALLALGLNLVFGVIDVVWISYAELVMVGMYGIYYAHKGGAPFLVAAVLGIVLVAVAGALIALSRDPAVLDQPPINQLLVTGGVLFFLQAAATMAFGIEFRSIGIRLGSSTPSTCRSPGRGSSPSGVDDRGHPGAVAVPDADLHGDGDPGDLAGPADHAAHGRRRPPRLSRHPRPSAAGSRASRRR
jgi:hypothetical protein